MIVDQMLIYGSMALVFLVLTILVLKKSLSAVNVTFALTPIFITINTLTASVVASITNDIQSPTVRPYLTLGTFPLLLAPLGFILAGLVILNGKTFIYEMKVVIPMIIYVLLAIVAVIIRFTATPQMWNSSFGINFILMTFPLTIGLMIFTRIALKIPELKTKFTFIITGFTIGILSLLIRSYSLIILNNDSLLGQLLLIIGVIIAIVAFVGTDTSSSSQT